MSNEKDRFKFKTWIIPLPQFRFVHQTCNPNLDHRDFFGREKDVDDFVNVLNENDSSGSYLVTGYRGAGKTSFISKVKDILSNGEPKSPFNNFLSDTVLNFAIFFGAAVYLLFAPFRGIGDILVLLGLFFLYYFNKYRFALLSPKQWLRWIFHPVVYVQVNLGHDIKDPKSVIFSIISLLREKYIEAINPSWIREVLSFFVVASLSAVLAIFLYRGFPEIHHYLETKMHKIVFNTPTLVAGKSCAGDHISDKLMFPYVSEPDKWSVNIKGGDSELTGTQLEFSGAQSRSGYVSFIRELILVPSYCAIYHISQDIYFFSYQRGNGWNKDGLRDAWLGTSDERLAWLLQGLDKWIMFFDNEDKANIISRTSFGAPKLLREIESIHANPLENENRYQELIPRPYQILFFILILVLFEGFIVWLSPTKRVIRRLDEIDKRIQASDILDTSGGFAGKLPFWRKRYQHFHRLDERQAESFLLQVLSENANNFLIQPRIIFLFDELDKIHPPKEQLKTGETVPVELGLSESVRQRQYEIEKLLGNLKNLITTAPCNFIFAAGREMMDANLADRGEIRFLHGTLFDRVFYLPSLLTDSSDGNRDDISSMIEQYVCRRLMSPTDAKRSCKEPANESNDDHYNYWTLETYLRYLENQKVDDYHRFRLVSFLQDFVYFLSYRSGGNIKKLALQFEEFIRPLPKQYASSRSEEYHPIINKMSGKRRGLAKDDLVLHFDSQEQYRIQLIAHFFTIFHGSYSKLVSRYGDKLSISVFSILDYVCKFHSMSFARRDLERMPGALDIHRAPALPQIIDVLIDKILSPYINKVDNGFYDFHFSRYIQREIVYISQFSEQDMAAFNFSLDESIQIKQHYRQILIEQIKLLNTPEQSLQNFQGTYVLPNLYMVLGDLHAQDNEFDQAMVEYQNAIFYLNARFEKWLKKLSASKNENNSQKVHIADLSVSLVSYIRILLKLGLLQERRLIYDSAIAIYYQAMQIVEDVLKENKAFFVENLEQLNLLFQPHLCLAFLHAKRGHSIGTADAFMQKALESISEISQESASPESALIYKHHIRWAEMKMMRSQFNEAIYEYHRAITALCRGNKLCQPDKLNAITFQDMGSVLTGFADACTALALYAHYDNAETAPLELRLPQEHHYDENANIEKLKDSVCEEFQRLLEIKVVAKGDESCRQWQSGEQEGKQEANSIDGISTVLLKESLGFYILASKAYRLAGSAWDEALILWKIAYAVAFGLSYSDKVGKGLTKRADINWLFRDIGDTQTNGSEKNPIRKVFSQAFNGSYSVQRTRLREEVGIKTEDKKKSHFVVRWITSARTFFGKTDNKKNGDFLRWIAPSLTQILMVLGHFWDAYWESGNKEVSQLMDESAFEIVDMGAFPMNARILALYLKGRWYQKYANGDNEYKRTAFRLLVEAVENGLAYEGGLDFLSPPLGIIHYHIWEIVRENDENQNAILKTVRQDFRADFRGDMLRYFSQSYCHNRTKKLLTELLSRHNSPGTNKDRYFTYMSKHYYLYDAFSDPYVKAMWAVEYGLVPVAKWMLNKMNETF